MKKLEIYGVNKVYKLENKQTFQALYDINVDFEEGELVSIIGESGSGKSTLMNLIGGLDSDFTGSIIADGENLKKLSEKELDKYRKNKVGFVFQSFNLISHLSILDNVTLALTLSNVSEKEKVAKATKILERVGLADQLKKKPNQLSGGQKQRVAIARALINDPEIIIADEPTGALDSTTAVQILEILKEIADSGKLVIMVTHSEKVASVSSRVVEISDGRIVGDRKNPKYKKNHAKNAFEEKEEKPQEAQESKPKKNYKDKQNLSIWQAIRLSMHNMLASKTKNILMSIGVAIGIGSLILMMCFSSGITDFISNTMNSYSNPRIVTISKRSNSIMGGFTEFLTLKEDEENYIVEEINKRLEEDNIDFRVSKGTETEKGNLSYGFNMFTAMLADPVVKYTDDPTDMNFDKGNILSSQIFLIYTTPPYYSQSTVADGKLSTTPELKENGTPLRDADEMPVGGGGFMFSRAIYDMFGEENPVGKKVKISFTIRGQELPEFRAVDEISGIVDTSVFSGILAVYIDYDYLKALFTEQGWQNMFAPTSLYIETPSESITNKINSYLAQIPVKYDGDGKELSPTPEGEEPKYSYRGSIEDQLGSMFTNMTSVIGTSLVVISCISLLVSAMMILVVLYMSVSERTKEIGVLKSIGARRKDIKRIFTSESFLVGLLSGFMGIIFNLILTLVVWLLLTNMIGLAPISYRWWYFAVAMAVAIVIAMLSGLYPASKAAKLDPVESLRRE